MKLFQLTCCNPSTMLDDKLQDAIEMALDPQGSLHVTLEGAKKTARDVVEEGYQQDDEDARPEGWEPEWSEDTWTIADLPGQEFRRWTFTDEASEDVWLIREMPVFGSDAFPE